MTLAPLAGCEEDEDSFSGYEVVNRDADPVKVVLATDPGLTVASGSTTAILEVQSGDGTAAELTISPTIVPVSYTADGASSDETVSVVVTVASAYVAEVDRVDISVAMGSGETIESIELDRDALVPEKFFVFLRPSCAAELRDEQGVCQIAEPTDCEVEDATVRGRCDGFTARLWRATEATATPTASEGSSEAVQAASPRWVRVEAAPEVRR